MMRSVLYSQYVQHDMHKKGVQCPVHKGGFVVTSQ